MSIKITGITKWDEDYCMIVGDASREGVRNVQTVLESERVDKLDHGVASGLPFVCEAADEGEALDLYNDTYCYYDYLKASECEWEMAS